MMVMDRDSRMKEACALCSSRRGQIGGRQWFDYDEAAMYFPEQNVQDPQATVRSRLTASAAPKANQLRHSRPRNRLARRHGELRARRMQREVEKLPPPPKLPQAPSLSLLFTPPPRHLPFFLPSSLLPLLSAAILLLLLLPPPGLT
ncbi:uncharacterized protein K452DRAFT_17792 [Aplosporella prunicola CBS 121167]|uniref:Uncharacterized protein n=1 Tax=Aplosporella prunicola CBS 121167 TaxID=1176127 RepID=A0A6A6BIJ3_9PEZI|nr:uncharacterized protein K452DRAFT_17792 [Aplosporella prunicola CBS 121167]KAF2142391.1 hypothetical protein K452DRAFT_17792 [Aplosporella prunicola CBS 121167]